MESISRRVARQNAGCSSSLLAPERDWSAYWGTVAINDLVELNLVVRRRSPIHVLHVCSRPAAR